MAFNHLDPAYAKYALFILLLVYINNQWSRYLLNYLYAVPYDESNPQAAFISIADATGISAAEYGLLVGYGFSFIFVVAGLFAGRAADLYNRVIIIAVGTLIWNASLFIMAAATSFGVLLLSRILLGLGQAFLVPPAYSIIADYFQKENLATANGIFAWGVYLGGGLSSLSIVMADSLGWKVTCVVVALIGLFLAVVVMSTIKEPPRTRERNSSLVQEEPDKGSFAGSLREICSKPLIAWIFVAASLRYVGGYAIAGYMAVYFEDEFADYSTVYSYLNASVVALGGIISSWAGGYLSDIWERAGNKSARVWVPALGSLLAIPFMIMTVLASNFYVGMLGLFLEYLFAECWFGPIMSILQSHLSARSIATAVGCYTFCVTMIGSLGSYLMGVYYDWAEAGEIASTANIVRYELLVVVVVSYFLAGLIFLYCHRYLGGRTGEAVLLIEGDEREKEV
eukprot:CAMPEP_0113940958 /NCGR_PEP_ID=MMETSP1339-20121228/6974_1 /TAXON_ID=94617 /ORGANISM="Fibrocapsa japonica" /LENGTH=453 /DNA_ID=CAMNT_0000944957 /DNA_START=10 /DNA_END=1371 /DNA_ORIENTATION=+ /assembly_acc=CAM_ASM_000762